MINVGIIGFKDADASALMVVSQLKDLMNVEVCVIPIDPLDLSADFLKKFAKENDISLVVDCAELETELGNPLQSREQELIKGLETMPHFPADIPSSKIMDETSPAEYFGDRKKHRRRQRGKNRSK